MKFHVHVYKLSAMREVDVIADHEDQACALATETAFLDSGLPAWKEPDNKVIALAFPLEGYADK